MASDTESIAPSILASDFADLSVGTEDIQHQMGLPDHDEHHIYHDSKTYKRGKAQQAKRRDRSPNVVLESWRRDLRRQEVLDVYALLGSQRIHALHAKFKQEYHKTSQ
jgi:hypothetical protein